MSVGRTGEEERAFCFPDLGLFAEINSGRGCTGVDLKARGTIILRMCVPA